MGIFAMLTFANNLNLYKSHQLCSTRLVIDGPNLEKALSIEYFNHYRADHLYGGDYNHLYDLFCSFFTSLINCNVTPIVIMDGTFDVRKLDRKLWRFNWRLQTAIELVRQERVMVDRVYGALTYNVFLCVLRKMDIAHYRSVQEADVIIPTIARHFQCPILSNDSDFLIDPTIVSGVISIDSILNNNLFGQTNSSIDHHLECKLYRIQHLYDYFPGLGPELIPLSGPLLGNDQCDRKEAGRIVDHISRHYPSGSFNPKVIKPSHQRRFKQLFAVFEWLAKQYTKEEALNYLVNVCGGDQSNPVVRGVMEFSAIAPQNCDLKCSNQVSQISKPISIEQYFTRHWNYLFPPHPDIPVSVFNRLITNRISKRLLDIYLHKFDLFTPLIEDFLLVQSSYQVIHRLSRYIYGLLRQTSSVDGDDEVELVRRIDRFDQVISGHEQLGELVDPLLYVILQHDPLIYVKLPKLIQIESLSRDYRTNLFCAIIQIDFITFRDEVRNVLHTKIDEKQIDLLACMFIGLIYQCRNSSIDVWMEFVYAMFVNILIAGHIGSNSMPVLFKLSDSSLTKLKFYLTQLKSPNANFKARITHLYASYQNVLSCIGFLAQILDLDYFHTDDYICSLQGSFIYNLTDDLRSWDNPLEGLERNVLEIGNSGEGDAKMFRSLLDLVLNYCEIF